MKSAGLVLLAALSLPLGACASTGGDMLASSGTDAAGASLADVAADSALVGAEIGHAVGGAAGAVWADRDNDGRVDGYVREGAYYPGAPAHQSAAAPRDCRPVGGSAPTGAAVAGLAGAIWADANNDGCVDGYIREGQYYAGAPPIGGVQPAGAP